VNLLNRLWTGIVGAVAGTAVAFVTLIAAHISTDCLIPLVASFAAVGFIAGFALATRKLGARSGKDESDK
jgi:hypothetical protein